MQLEKGQAYQVKPTSINPRISNGNHKTFTRNSKTHYVYDMVCVFKSGESMTLEFTPTKQDVSEVVLGVYQWFKVVMVNAVGVEVEPFDPEASSKQCGQTSESNSTYNAVRVNADGASRTFPPTFIEGCGTLNVSGLAINFATAWAKDLLVAELANCPGRIVTVDDIEKMTKWAGMINDSMCKKITQ